MRSDPWCQLLRGVWVHKDVELTRAVRVAAVKLILGEAAFICGLTAAWIYGIEPRDKRRDLVWMGSPTGTRPRTRTGCHVREITVDEADLQIIDGLVMTTPLRTVFDCARWLTPVEAVVVADALAHEGLVTPEELAGYRKAHPGLRGNKQVDLVVNLMDGRSESPQETRLRLVLIFGGLPCPEPQYVVEDANGDFVARVDLAYVEERVIVEYDGSWHFGQRRHDDRRRAALRDLGWHVIVVSSEDMRNPAAIVAEVSRALAKAAA
jgi:Protein of unknown function (DUF559)